MPIRLSILCFALFCVPLASSNPEELKSWESWVLKTHPEHACPTSASSDVSRRCAWPGKLILEISDAGADFAQHWEVRAESWLRIPGGRNQWPQDVTIDGEAATVLHRGGSPVVRVAAGSYTTRGTIRWGKMPQHLFVPADTALIDLTLHGKRVLQPNLREGRILLKDGHRSSEVDEQGDTIKIEVFRKLSDAVPMRLDSELRIAVSGQPREILTGQLLPQGAEIIALDSPLPARIEADGRLRMQVRPGEWILRLRARYTGVTTDVGFLQTDEDWPDQEVWVFAAAPRLRGVTLAGAPPVDPSQLQLPDNWHNLPTWILGPGVRLRLTENWRGDETPAANVLQLNRTFWLDFSGDAATVRDAINGTMNQGWRLEVDGDMKLGRVAINGEAQLVTTVAPSQVAGIEIRRHNLQLDAVSRLDSPTDVSATGWQANFQQVKAVLNLPPGWRLWHAAGPDSVTVSWLSQWDLWDLFLCLLIVGSSYQLLGPLAGLLSLSSLALSYHVAGSPVWGWLLILICLPLLRNLPKGRFQQLVKLVSYVVVLLVTLIAIGFSVQQVRSAIYPQLEQAGQIHRYARRDYSAPLQAPEDVVEIADRGSAPEALEVLAKRKIDSRAEAPRLEQPRYQPVANVQTGPGVPKWRWRQVHLGWDGPVHMDDRLSLWLSPPWLSRWLNGIEVLLVWGYLLMLVRAVLATRAAGSEDTAPTANPIASTLLAIVLGGALTAAPEPARADNYPPEHLLQELERRLLKPPACHPECAAIHQVGVSLDKGRMTIRLRISTGNATGVPLPLGTGWEPRTVLVDSVATQALARWGESLEVALEPGNHSLVIEGPITADTIKLPFALPAHNIRVSAPQWDVLGVVDEALPGGTLELQKREKSVATETLLPDPIAPFFRIRRHIAMDIDWTMTTTVIRVAPIRGAVSVKVPVLPGESVVTPGIKVESGAVVTTLASNAASVSWRSVMAPATELILVAPQAESAVESWLIEASPRWNISASGLHPVKAVPGEGTWASHWQPWPGESLIVTTRRPTPVAGSTTTVESARLELDPGARSSNVTLSLAIRSSLGGDYHIGLLEPAELLSILLDGREQALPKQDKEVSVTLHPGLQSVVIKWQLPRGVSLLTSTPSITLSSPANNIDLAIQIPRSRWALLVRGPDIGPAMLYWGILVVIIGIAIGLGLVVKRFDLDIPLTTWHWLLLAIGMSTVNMVGSVCVVAWFFLLEARKRLAMPTRNGLFNLVQVILIIVTLLALANLFYTIPQSLLSVPNMQVTGNGSSNYFFQWYQDRSGDHLPQAGMFSVPLLVYRLAMLLWSLWLVFALLRWLRWGWGCFSRDGLWRKEPAHKV